MSAYVKEISCKEMKCIEFSAGGYVGIIAPEIGSNVIRLRNTDKNVEIFRWSDDVSGEQIKQATEIWGLPSLYLPNRLNAGVLKASDQTYNFPINETLLGNYIHGFVHKRTHVVESCTAEDDKATVVTSFNYDETDEMFKYFPVKFKYELTFTLSAEGLCHEVRITNLSDSKLPISFATHTTINAPFVDGGKQEDIRLCVPALKNCELDERCLPTERVLELSDWDKDYVQGKTCPVLQDISNDMYTAGMNNLYGNDFYGIIATDLGSGIKICNEVSREYKFWIVWNDRGFNGYFCPEPMTAMIDAPNLSLPAEETGYVEVSKGETYYAWQKFFVKN